MHTAIYSKGFGGLVTLCGLCISIEVGDGDGVPDKGLRCFTLILLVLDGVFENNLLSFKVFCLCLCLLRN
jgi:hypothetical protein